MNVVSPKHVLAYTTFQTSLQERPCPPEMVTDPLHKQPPNQERSSADKRMLVASAFRLEMAYMIERPLV